VAIVIDRPLQFQHPTGSSFRDLKTTAQKLRLSPLAHRLQNFFRSTSCNMCLSRVRSATNDFSFLFSSSNCRNRFRHWCSALSLPHCVEHLLRREVLPHPPSCGPENRFAKPEILTFLWSSFSGMCQAPAMECHVRSRRRTPGDRSLSTPLAIQKSPGF
jgi:hypothetical protein